LHRLADIALLRPSLPPLVVTADEKPVSAAAAGPRAKRADERSAMRGAGLTY